MQGKLEHYKVFKAVADAGNISEAAKKMFISQSAVSQSVKLLEESLGVHLFSRSKRGVTLTKDGITLYDYVSAALSLLESGESKLEESKNLVHGEIVIGASNTLTDGYLIPYLQKYHRLYPGVKVRILNGTSKRVMEYLDSSVVDIAFVTTNEKPEGYNSHLCFRTHTAFVAANDYPIDFNRSYSLKEISKLPLILLEKEAGSRRFLEDIFLHEGLRLEPEIELASYELLISLAHIGLGIAGITEELSKDALKSGQVRKLEVNQNIPTRAVSMLTSKATKPSPAAGAFIELIKS